MNIYNVYQSGKRLYIDEKEIPDNKIVVNKYDNMQQTLRLISDGTLPPRLYWALRNPKLSNKYFILKLINNQDLIVGTDISATPGLWDMLLIGTDEDYIIEGTDIDQSRLTYVSDHFGRLFVRDNFLEELDFEEQTSPTFKVFYDEIMFQLDNIPDLSDIPDKMSDLENDTNFISGVAFKDDGKGNVEIVGTTFSSGETEEGGGGSSGNVEVDDKLDEESTNPVQNKVVAKEVSSLKEKDKSLDKEVIALRERNTKLEQTVEKLQIKTTTSPSPFHHITDSANMKVLDFGMEGKTEQFTTSGKNLLPTDTLYVDGTSRVKTAEFVLEAGTYMLNSINRTMIGVIVDNITDGGYLTNGWTETSYIAFSVDSKKTITVRFATDDISLIDGNWMLTKGSVVDTTYEPYTGNQPSPNPDYPQEIVNAGVLNEETGRYEIGCSVVNKNLFDLKAENVTLMTTKTPMENIENGIRLTYTNVIDCYVRLNFKLLPNTTYTLCCNTKVESNNSNQFIAINITNGKWYNSTQSIAHANSTESNPIVKFTTPNTTEDIYIYLVGNALYSNITGVTEFTDFTLSVDGLTDFTPHQSAKFTLTSPVPLTKWDYLTKRDGVWGWSINSIRKIFDGSETIGLHAHMEDLKKIYEVLLQGVSRTWSESDEPIYCNSFAYVPGNKIYTQSYTQDYVFSAVYDNKLYFASLSDEGIFESVDTFKEYLKTAGVTVVCKASTEQAFHPLPDEEQELLHNLETYYGVTNLYNDQGCPITLTYISHPQLYVNQKLEQINNALLSLGANI